MSPALSPLQILPIHAVEMIVDHVANNIRLAFNNSNDTTRPTKYYRLQIPLLWVCRNFRAVVYLRFFKCYELRFDRNIDRAVGGPTPYIQCLERFAGPIHLVAHKVRILLRPWAIYSGKALTILSRVPYNGCSFPLARTLEIYLHSSLSTEDATAMPLGAEANVSAFVQRIRQMAPMLNLLKLSGGIDPSNNSEAAYRLVDSLTTQLVQFVDRVELTHGFDRAPHSMRVDSIRDLTYLHSYFGLGSEQIMQLVRLNAPTLRYLSIVSRVETDLSYIIQDTDGRFVEYPYIHTLVLKQDTSWSIPQQYAFDGAVPFPSLRRLISSGDLPFGDGLVLFRGNAASLEHLRLTLTHELAVALLRHNVFTPISHPRLQCVMFKTPQGPRQVNFADNPEIVHLMLSIAPGAAVREVSNWSLNQAPRSLVLSLLSKHTSLQVLALPDVRLSIWDAMTLIKSLPLLSDLHSKAPTLDPMPEGITERNLVAYVTSNYSPIGRRFRCWHATIDNDGYLRDAVISFLLLAFACPNFDYAAFTPYTRDKFAGLLENTIDTTTYREHAPRLRRLLPRVLE
ncbi:hypothetical protein GGI13_002100 [Coemansia sp. RSA 455]|nr:hypothetical protein GGI14_005181 [Coemansia sp. S680]KAJ2070459.1 hypothetical protein GGH13_004013 [Coemansia sp. S155-1]KAJ2100774.1 hypothetical protein GGI09_002106 [Coemansia sp. S100]KAJ2254533.1 hypothetical protein GGI13_002100 [Coemansia sp. RSA 455]